MRIVHATDIHWFVPPTALQLASKRALGTANLYLRHRKDHFDARVQRELVDAMDSVGADVLLVTGDLTAQALPAEFALAREALDPLLSRMPAFVQNGNHDVYTGGSARDDRIATLFEPWLHRTPDGLARLRLPGLTVIGLDPCRPHITASGLVPAHQLAALPAALEAAPQDDAVILALHYPVLDRSGALYDRWAHGLRNAGALVEVLRSAPRAPTLIVHGHQHHGFTVPLHLHDVDVPIHDPGSSGYAWLPEEDRAACFNVYTVEGPALVGVERYRFGAEGFEPEAGGAYATGR